MSYVQLLCDRELIVSLNSADMDTTTLSSTLPAEVRDVLLRDQRTVRTLSRHQRRTTPFSIFLADLSYRTTASRLQRLREVFTLCACFLAIVRLPTTLSAPAMTNPIDFDKPPIWKSPCNFAQDAGDGNKEYPDENGPTNKEIFEKVVILAQTGIDELIWKNSWVQKNFGKDFQTYFNEMKTVMNPPEYLPSFTEIKKSFGEPIPEDVLKSLDTTATLQNTFEWLQRVAVGMEQLTYDQYNEGESHAIDFKNAFFALRSVLCEIQDAMVIMKVQKSKEVDRKDMPDGERKTENQTDRKVRDWTIFITYINLLEYTKQAYEHLALQEH